MRLGFVGLGKMGYNMVTRLRQGEHEVIAFDVNPDTVKKVTETGAVGAGSLKELVGKLSAPRVVWLMVPSGEITEKTVTEVAGHLTAGDIIVDGGNSNFHDTQRRAEVLKQKGLHFVDAGTSGGVWGLKIGYCLMVGGEAKAFKAVEPALETLAPKDGYLHVGPPGAGHYVKMIHNGIEYGMMQAYAEGFEILEASDYDLDLAPIAHLWNQGSVIRSWLLELAELAFRDDPKMEEIRGYVSDSGEGRWTVQEAIDRDVPAVVLAYSLFSRFRSRQDDSFGDRVLASLRNQFGGHAVKEK